MKSFRNPTINFVHYWFYDLRGGEQVVKNFFQAMQIQKLYALCGRIDRVNQLVGSVPVSWSVLNKIPHAEKLYRNFLPFYPLACNSLKVDECDIVISNESGPAKSALMPKNALHICNCLTPMRYLWSHSTEYLDSFPVYKRIVFRSMLPFLRHWDYQSSKKVHTFIAISEHVKKRIAKYYGRESEVIYPPVRYNMFSATHAKEDYYLILSALVSYKRVDLAIEAFNRLGLKLKIAGDGPDMALLKKMAGPNIEFLGRIPDSDLPSLYGKAKAFVFPGEEDYGITPLEAQASGTPVIALRRGGAEETVIERKTGLFFDREEVDLLVNTVKEFEISNVLLNPLQIREMTAKFSEEEYQAKIKEFVFGAWEGWCRRKNATS